jgi:hypothetical protein
MTTPSEELILGPERLPDGRINWIRFLLVTHHANKGHPGGMVSCQDQSCLQYRAFLSEIAQLRKIAAAAQLRRNTVVNLPNFKGEWVAVPREDFDALREALDPQDPPA